MPNEEGLRNLTVHLDEETRKVIVTFTPEESVEPETGAANVTAAEIRQAIDAAGFGGHDIQAQALESAAAKYKAGNAFELSVGAAVDGEFVIHLDPQGMAAYLNCSLALGGKVVQMQDILQEAQENKITASLDLEAIKRALQEGGKDIVIATGRAPVPGIDGHFESLVPGMKKRTPHLDEHGLADFRDLGDIVTVRAGDALMRRIPPTSGQPGETVTGKVIPVKPGKNYPFSARIKGAALDPGDQNLLIADIAGCPVVSKDGVSVEPAYLIQNVDLHIGNVSYDGTVHVTGDVMSDMTVKATGDIYVDGTVQNATLEAGGDIVVKGGIIGGTELHDQLLNKTQIAIQCKGSCTARFVQNIRITAGNSIFIHDVAMLSELTAGQTIIVGDPSTRKGDIIGGSASATMLVKAKNIGSSANLKTEITVGADKALHVQENDLKKNREDSESKLLSILKVLKKVHENPDLLPPEKVKAAEVMREALRAEIENFTQEEMEVKKEIDLAHHARVEVENHVFAGTIVSMGLQHCNVAVDKQGGVFSLNEENNFVFI